MAQSSAYWKGVNRKWRNVSKHFKKKEKTIKQLKSEKEHLIAKEEAWTLKKQKQRHREKLKKEIASLKMAKAKKTPLGKLYYSEHHVKPLTKKQKKSMVKSAVKFYNSIAGG